MTWKGLAAIAAFGAVAISEGHERLGIELGATGSELKAELAGTAVAGRLPHGKAVFEQPPAAPSSHIEVEALNLPHDTVVDSWVNATANAPCEGTRLGSATLDATGGAVWNLDPSTDELPEVQEGNFVSICVGAQPLVSGNLRQS